MNKKTVGACSVCVLYVFLYRLVHGPTCDQIIWICNHILNNFIQERQKVSQTYSYSDSFVYGALSSAIVLTALTILFFRFITVISGTNEIESSRLLKSEQAIANK